MRNYSKILVAAAIAGSVCQQAGAGPTPPSVGTLYTSAEVFETGSGPAPPAALNSFDITSEALHLSAGTYKGDYEYIYNLPAMTATTPPVAISIDVFSVYLNGTQLIEAISGNNSWTGMENLTDVSWTHKTGDVSGDETLTFVSPDAPTWGTASAQDSYQWTDAGNGLDNGVVVPNFTDPGSPVPDGGLTVALLGGSFLVLGLIRRKLKF
jgi:hypothetical protein